MRITDVDPLFENDNPQLAQLNQLLATAKEPWEAAQYKWRIQNLQNIISLDKGVPVDSSGKLKPVVDARTWMKQNPSLVKSLPKAALPPEMQQPGVNEARRFGSSSYDPDYRGSDQYNNEVEELEGLLSQSDGSFEQEQRRNFLSKKYGITGPADFSKLQAIKNNELARIGALQQNLVKASDEEDAKFAADQERELALRAKYGAFAQPPAQQDLQESVELNRIKYLSKVLRG